MTWEPSALLLPSGLLAGAAVPAAGVFLDLTLGCKLKLDMREDVIDSVGLGDGLVPSFACLSCALFQGGT